MIAPAGQGGTLQYSHNLCAALAAAGHDVVLATAIGSEIETFPRRYRLIGVFDRFRPRPGPLARFARLLRSFRPEIVHLQGAQRPEFYWLLLRFISTFCRTRFLWTPQDVVSNSAKPYHPWLQRRNYARMDHVFLNARQNEAAVRDTYGVPAERITVQAIPDLLDFIRTDLTGAMPPDLNWRPDGKPLVLCIGLIETRKGISHLIEAFGRLARDTEARLLIMGKPLTDIAPYSAALADAGLPPDRAQILPRYATFEEMAGLFDAATVVVLPYLEGWNSGVLSAAYGFGKAVLATRVGGLTEAIRDGETGLLVPPGNVDALEANLRRLLNDDDLRRRLQDGALAEHERFTWNDLAATTISVYDRVAGRGTDG